ncbi:Translation initiation factor 3 subunit c [Coemansia asiatica]|uniref:Eukaryotic translation initiation factor 3 subunit C n=1 Tax=Coemansia asiatica TaxID=1052880 RepID=A0A9W7XMT9_9FUNG|nr:Translation initiation factor 3 subunit c [Coemansia asiatica]KAJ2878441.1 Translation initiation factor 3 subunit c [Coemansia asiatica]
MSRFFRSANLSSSDSESSGSSSDSESSVNEVTQRPPASAGTARFSRAVFSSDDEGDSVKRVVKSPKQKQTEELVSMSRDIIKAVREDKWQSVAADFDKLRASAKKLSSIVKGEGMPRTFIRCLVVLEDSVEEKSKDKTELGKLSTTDARSLNQVKQRLRKYKEFSAQVSNERANPRASDDEIDEGSEADSEEEQAVPAAAAASSSRGRAVPSSSKSKAAVSDSESESESGNDSDDLDDSDDDASSSNWGSGSDSDSESDSGEDSDAGAGFSRWLKKTPAKGEDVSKKAKKEKPQRAAAQPAVAGAAASKHEASEEEDDGFTTVGKRGKAVQGPVYSAESINKFLMAYSTSRGRKGTDKKAAISMLEKLLTFAANPLQKAKVLMALISAQFDDVPAASFMSTEKWHKTQNSVNELLSVLETNHQIKVFETAEAHETDDDIKYKNEPISLRGSVIGFVDRLDDEFTKSLQNIDPHTPKYVERMRDTVPLYVTIVRAQHYFERCDLKDSICRIVLRRIEHLYYRTDQVNLHVEAAVADLPSKADSSIIPATAVGNMEAIIHSLCTYLYHNAEPLLRTRAMLMHIFNHALHKRYYVARDLMLMSHIQENVHQADVNTQVLYNRALAQLGLAAFRLGKIQESFDHTVELESSARQRELLAQGVSQQRTQQLSPSEELLQRQRQLPFHININLELLECVFLTSSMLLEIPFMASANANPEARRAPISRVFRRMLDFNERQVFLGPPENTRDYIMASAKALASGDWEAARDNIQEIKIWSLLPDCEEIKQMLAAKIQIEALRTYLFTYSTQFESIGLEDLSTMFGMSKNKVYCLLARMVYNGELQASLDEVSGVLVFNMANFEASSRLQQTAMALSNKVNSFADINERMFELKINGGQVPNERQQGNADHSGKQQSGERDGRQNQQRGGNRDGQRGGNNAGGNQGQNRKDGGGGGGGGAGGQRGGGGNRNGGRGRGQRRNNNRR